MGQAGHAVLFGYPLQGQRQQLLVIGRQVGELECWSNFILSRSDFVVTCLDRDAQFERFPLNFQHE